LCLRYSKLGPARFTSARDIARLMERAIKRACLPVAYSSGFSPHQRVSYAYPAPTGAASHAEYLMVGLTALGDCDGFVRALDAQLPGGIHAEAGELTDDRRRLAQLDASRWRLETPAAGLALAVATFMASPEVIIERRSKSGLSRQDVRDAVVSLAVDGPAIVAVVKQSDPLIRPVDVLAGLGVAALGLPTREAQGRLGVDGGVTNLV